MPILVPLLGLISGILIGNTIKFPGWGLIPILSACAVYLFILKKTANPFNAIKYNNRHSIWIFLLFCGIGIIDMGLRKPQALSERHQEKAFLAEGVVTETKCSASGDRFIVSLRHIVDSLDHVHTIHNVKILLYTDGYSANDGDIITFPARFFPIQDNPNFRPSGFTSRMNRSGIYHKSIVKENEIQTNGYHNSLSTHSSMWRNRLIGKIEQSSLSRPASNFISALLFGDRSFITKDTHTAFSNAGVAHVLALSGMHIAIILSFILLTLFPLKIFGLHSLRLILAILIIWCYAFFTGLAPSTVRAGLMATLAILGLCLQRRNHSENSLLVAVFVILVCDPSALFDVGLQLSFLCVGSIIIFADRLNPVDRKQHPYYHSFFSALLVSLVTTLTSWVVIAYYFKTIPLLFLPANLLLLPLLPIYMWIAIIYVLLLITGFDLPVLSFVLSKAYDLFEQIVESISSFGASAVSLDIQLPVVIFWLIGILALTLAIKKKTNKRRALIFCGCTLLALSLATIPFISKNSSDSVIFQKNFNQIALTLYDGDNQSVKEIPRNTVSRIMHKGCEILSIDCNVTIDSLLNQYPKTQRRRRYLIIGSGAKSLQLGQLPEIRQFEKIILHSSLKRKMETALKEQADELGLNTLYSLREEGPLEEFLPDSLPGNK